MRTHVRNVNSILLMMLVGPVGLEPTTVLLRVNPMWVRRRIFFHSPPFATVRFELGFTPVRSRGRLAESPRFAVNRLIGCQMGVKPADQMFEASRELPPRERDREVRPGVRLRPAILLVRVPTRSATFRTAVWSRAHIISRPHERASKEPERSVIVTANGTGEGSRRRALFADRFQLRQGWSAALRIFCAAPSRIRRSTTRRPSPGP